MSNPERDKKSQDRQERVPGCSVNAGSQKAQSSPNRNRKIKAFKEFFCKGEKKELLGYLFFKVFYN